jgi:hypothetical protein
MGPKTFRIIVVLLIFIALLICGIYFFGAEGYIKPGFTDIPRSNTADTFFHVKSFSIYQPLNSSKSVIYLVLDSPRLTFDTTIILNSPRLAYDTAYPSADVLVAASVILQMKYCLYNKNAQKIAGSPNPLK